MAQGTICPFVCVFVDAIPLSRILGYYYVQRLLTQTPEAYSKTLCFHLSLPRPQPAPGAAPLPPDGQLFFRKQRLSALPPHPGEDRG